MTLPKVFSSVSSRIEPLEQRIAPALLIHGANLLGGAGNPTTGETSIGGHSVTLVKVLSGNAIVYYDEGGIEAISVGPNTKLDITGDVGTVIANLTASGHLSDSDGIASNGLDGDVLLNNNILGITTHPLSGERGSIGQIITGGSISNLSVSGYLSGVYAGDGVFRVHPGSAVSVDTNLVDVNPVLPGVQHGFTFASANAKTVLSGASISNLTVQTAEELQVFAGDGFSGLTGKPGLAGGSITNVNIVSAFVDTGLSVNTPSYSLVAGDGGHGTTGGAGGSITKVLEGSSTGVVQVIAGQGGAGTSGPGGAGGSLTALDMQSDSSSYTIHAGKGGIGTVGGKGGSVTGVNFAGDTPSSGIIVRGDFTGDGVDDVLLVDTGSGNMVLEQNNGNGTSFSPVVQDTHTMMTQIGPDGTTPVAAKALDVNGDGNLDIVVAYKNSSSLGIYYNQGGGVFYQENFSNNVYSGDTLEAASIALPNSPSAIAVGNFTGTQYSDIAILSSSATTSVLNVVEGDGAGNFSLLTSSINLEKNAVALVAAPIQTLAKNSTYLDLFAGFKSGNIVPLLSTGSDTSSPFTVGSSGVTVPGGIANLDANPNLDQLMALNSSGTALNIYNWDTTGTLALGISPTISSQPGHAVAAYFVPDLGGVQEPVAVLSSIANGSRLDIYGISNNAYGVTSSTQTTEILKTFVPVVGSNAYGIAALGGSLGHFAFSESSAPFIDFSLPFAGKKLGLVAGDGGAAFDLAGHGLSHGGAGGTVSGVNADAADISVVGGNGGASGNGPAGVGGSVFNPASLVTASGKTLVPAIFADTSLLVAGGDGGTASGTVKTAVGGAGGSVTNFSLTLITGDIQVSGGSGGAGGGGAGGSGGSVSKMQTLAEQGSLELAGGDGGAALGGAGNGGAGGSVTGITHKLILSALTEMVEQPYNVNIAGGGGGSSVAGVGGAGGSVSALSLTLQPSHETYNDSSVIGATHVDKDSTLRIDEAAGNGGNGATGGAGGSLKTLSAAIVYDQTLQLPSGGFFVEINPVTAQLNGGNGGTGSVGAGGAGGAVGAVSLSGISHFDPDITPTQDPLVIVSGNGGNGVTKGGAGGAITGIASFNAAFNGNPITATQLSGATVTSGHGGNGGTLDGGAGGAISGLSIGVQGDAVYSIITNSQQTEFIGGSLMVQSGGGGTGGAHGKGGAGGLISSSLIGCDQTYVNYGLLVEGGAGGSGGNGGGAGGGVTGIQLNSPENPVVPGTSYDALSAIILAGNGGNGTGATGAGGLGGGISKISQSKDVNSAINVLQAGNGGASASAAGGAGGSVAGVKTVGLIGQASDDNGATFGVFQTGVAPGVFSTLFPHGVPQGVFSGRGGVGVTNGSAGSVTSISAAEIAAIGAAADANGHFAAASKVAGVTAQVIAYDQNGNGLYNNASGANDTPPDTAVAIDGFIFAKSVSGVTTGTAGGDALLKTFTFIG